MNSWFPHDSTAASDAKILKLRSRYGWEGYALYFVTLEWLYQCADAVALRSDMPSLCVLFGKDEEYTKLFIDYCIEIELFECENDTVYSPRLKSEKSKEIEKSARAKESAERRWNKKKHKDANAMRTQCEGNAPPVSTHPTHPTQNTYTRSLAPSAEVMEELDEFIRWLNNKQLFPNDKVATDKARKKWKTRRLKYPARKIAEAFSNLVNEPDKWKIENNGHRPLAWWLHSDERIEDMLNCHLKQNNKSNFAFIS